MILLLAGGLPPLALICFAVVPLTLGVLSRRSAIKSGYKAAGRTRAFAGLFLGGLVLAAGLAAPSADKRTIKKAQTVTTLHMATKVEEACQNFQVEYGYPPSGLPVLTTDSADGITLLNVLSGLESASSPLLNPRGIKFLTVREGKRVGNRGRSGLIWSNDSSMIEGLFDPWGNAFTVFLDTDDDNTLSFRLGNRQVELKNRRVAVFSPGPDHKEGTEDDVRTW